MAFGSIICVVSEIITALKCSPSSLVLEWEKKNSITFLSQVEWVKSKDLWKCFSKWRNLCDLNFNNIIKVIKKGTRIIIQAPSTMFGCHCSQDALKVTFLEYFNFYLFIWISSRSKNIKLKWYEWLDWPLSSHHSLIDQHLVFNFIPDQLGQW